MLRKAIISFVSLMLLGPNQSVSFAREFYLAGWNVENLFDTEDDLAVEKDEEFTPTGIKQWTSEKLEIRLNKLASIIRKMNDGRGPDVLGVCEIENRKIVEMLVAKLSPLGRKYEIVHRDSTSDRGVDCAIIYDANAFQLVDSKFHFVDAEKTRDVVEAHLRSGKNDLYVFMNHWPSRGNDEWQRCLAAHVLRKRLDEILAKDPHADFVLLGDFNDEATNASLAKFLKAAPAPENLPSDGVFDTAAHIRAEGKGTFVYKNKWDLLDHIIISQGLMDDAGFRWKPGSTERIEFRELFFTPHYPDAIEQPHASFDRDTFDAKGYADHLPLGCVIVE